MPLAGNRKELETVLENISDGILFIDNKGAIKVYNKSLSDMLSISDDLTGKQIFSLPMEDPLRQGIFRADSGFPGPYCWERNNCPADTACPGKNSQFCRCWVFSACELYSGNKSTSCIECQQYKSVKMFLEKPKELEIGEKVISVLSSFIEFSDKDEIWEVIVFKDVTREKLDAVVKLANATAHELRQPLQAIIAGLYFLTDKLPEDEKAKEVHDMIRESCHRMNDIIEKISSLTRYKTKHYIRNQSILDLDGSSEGGEKDHQEND